MSLDKALRWWPVVGVVAMVLLGLAVGRGSTPLDDWFIRTGDDHQRLGYLLVFTDPRLLLLIAGASAAVAIYRRRWRLAAVVVAAPGAALVAERTCKHLFGREKGGLLAYPSGHVTLATVVAGMAALVAGTTIWAVAASVMVLLGVVGQAFTYHYFTDTIGAVCLATALLAVAARAAGLHGSRHPPFTRTSPGLRPKWIASGP